MTEKAALIKNLLNYEFFKDNEHQIIDELFPKQLRGFIRVVIEAQKKYQRDITLAEVWELFKSLHPTMTQAKLQEVHELVTVISKEEVVSPDIAEEILRNAWREHLCNQVATDLLELGEGNTNINLDTIRTRLEQIENGCLPLDEIEYTTTDISEILSELKTNYKWTWNLEPLNNSLGGFGPGLLGILAARPDVGKTGFWVNFVFGLNGWLAQGAKVHVLCNEEPAVRTIARGCSAYTGLTQKEISENIELAKDKFSKIQDNIFILDKAEMSIEELDLYCNKHKDNIDILIIDQIDKLGVRGNFGRTDERLQVIYEKARAIAKKYDVAILAITQAGEGAHGKMHYGYDKLNNSKTGKAAEADFILCIGVNPADTQSGEDSGLRCINIPKNKSPSGSKSPIMCQFDFNLSRVNL